MLVCKTRLCYHKYNTRCKRFSDTLKVNVFVGTNFHGFIKTHCIDLLICEFVVSNTENKNKWKSFILLDFCFWWTLKFANISSPSVLVIVISQYLIWSSFLHCCIHIVVIKEKLFNIQWTILFYWSQNWFSFPIFRFWAYLVKVTPETRRAY